ncbi:MAG: hypothetical protein CMJ18_28290, partial [Phycisphaeraceae bacterium]|nr:hypothetical protein [Phycisphaeraceae bacterium]
MSHDSPACLQRLESRLLLTAIYEIIDLGTLGGPSSTAAGLNASHQVVGQSLVDPSPARARAFIWDPAAGMTALDLIEGYTLDQAAAVADDGTAVGTARNAAFDERAVMWGEAGPVDLGTLGGAWSRGADVNETGQIVGTSALPEGGEPDAIETFHAFLWQDGIMTDLGTLGGTRSQAKAISDSGQVVGLSFPQDAPTFHAFSWQDGVMIDLGTLGGPASSAHDVSVSGLVVGDADLDRLDREGFNQYHAAVWREGRVTDLGTLGGEFSSALGINETGRIVGWSEMRRKDVLGQPVEHAFVYDHDGMRNLNDL